MKDKTADQIVSQLWHHIKNQEWTKAKELLSEDFEAYWPQSNEKFNRDNFIEVNRTYPGTHKIEIMNVWSEHDQWMHGKTQSDHPGRVLRRGLQENSVYVYRANAGRS